MTRAFVRLGTPIPPPFCQSAYPPPPPRIPHPHPTHLLLSLTLTPFPSPSRPPTPHTGLMRRQEFWPLVENPEMRRAPVEAWGRSEYSHACFARWEEFRYCLISTFPVHSHFLSVYIFFYRLFFFFFFFFEG